MLYCQIYIIADFLAKEIIFDDAVKTDAIRGVLPQLMNLYMADNDKQFHCLKDKVCSERFFYYLFTFNR